MNQPKRNLKIWIPIAAVLCFWLGDWMGYTYELTEGTTTHRLADALNLNSLLLHPFRLSADAFSLGCGIAAALMTGLIYLCVKYSKHRLMPQKEYGSARWGGPEDIAPFLNENPQNNLPLTASESLSLSPKMKVTANDNYNRNKNVIVFGPSGSGKSYSVAGPQLLQFNSNYVLSDPKGELLQEYGNVLLSQGYKVKVFNLKDRDKSDHYNLFAYIKNEDDILVVTKNLVKNLKEDPTAKSTADPIWEEGMTALLEALIGYVFYELEPEERNMNSVMTLLLMLESQGDGPNSVSQLDLLFDDLSINKPNSFAAKQYKLYKMAPGKTAQSINVSLGLRMSAFNIPSIANICADDTIDLLELGSEKKVALFVVTPDTTTAYNFLAAVMFQQCFQILVDIADHRPDKRLPRHLRFLLDEFPNIGMIPDFQILISTIRSRDIACTLIYQSLNQLKSQYKDDWATIYENCDSMIVLGAGGNPENLEFFSKALGKATIEVMNTSENKGSQGSYTKSYQALGRELMTPEEIRTMPRNWCLLMISGVAPFYSRKYNLKNHPNYHLVEAEGGKPFDYDRRAEQSFADFISNVKDVSVIDDPQKIGQLYPENAGKKKSVSNRTEIRKRLNFCLERATDYSQFLSMAKELEITPTIRGKHMSYLLDGAGRAVRDNSLSDTDTFTYAGICARLSDNAQEQKYLRKTITGILRSATGMADFADKLKTAGIETKVKKSTEQVLYRSTALDGAWVPEDALGSEFTSEGIEYALKNGKMQLSDGEENSLLDCYQKLTIQYPEVCTAAVKLSSRQILSAGKNGLVLQVHDDNGNPAKLMVNKSEVTTSPDGEITFNVGNDFSYDLVYEDETHGTIRGAKLIQQIDEENHVEPVQVILSGNQIKAMSIRGVTLHLPQNGIERLFIPEKYVLRDLDAGQCTVLLYPNLQYSYVPIGDSKKRLNIQGDRLSEFLGSSINPITESTGLKRKIAAVERRAGIENAKFLGKMLQGMTDSRIHTTGDYDKVIHNLGKTQIGLTNELAEVKQKRTTYAAAAKHLQICKTYKPVWMEYAAKPLNQKMEYFNQHSTELQAYRNAAAYLEKESIDQSVEIDKVNVLAQEMGHRMHELVEQLRDVNLQEQKVRQERQTLAEIRSGLVE